MTPLDYALLAGLLGVMCAVLLLVLLLRPFEGEPMVKLHPENMPKPTTSDWRSAHVDEQTLQKIMRSHSGRRGE